MHSISSSEEKSRIELIGAPLLHKKNAGEAESCPFSLLVGILHPQWTIDGKETACLLVLYGALAKRHQGDGDQICVSNSPSIRK